MVLDGTGISEDAQIDSIVYCRIVAWWQVQHRPSSTDLESPLSGFLVLPDPPHPVDVAMVKPEERLVGTVVELVVVFLGQKRSTI